MLPPVGPWFKSRDPRVGLSVKKKSLLDCNYRILPSELQLLGTTHSGTASVLTCWVWLRWEAIWRKRGRETERERGEGRGCACVQVTLMNGSICTYTALPLYDLKHSHKNGYTQLNCMANSTWKCSENNKIADNGLANPSLLVPYRNGSEYHFRLGVSKLTQKLCNC